MLLSTNVSKMQPVKAGTHTPHTHVAAVTLAKCCETGVQARTGTQTFLPSCLFNFASPVTQGFGKKNNLEKKVSLNRSLEVTVGKNSASSPCEPQSNGNTSLFSFPAPDKYPAKGIKNKNLLQLLRHTNPVGRHQYCLGCKSSKQGEVARTPTHLLCRRQG